MTEERQVSVRGVICISTMLIANLKDTNNTKGVLNSNATFAPICKSNLIIAHIITGEGNCHLQK